MTENRVSCGSCGAPNNAAAQWCARCLTPIRPVVRVYPPPPPGSPARRSTARTWGAILSAGLVVSLVIGAQALDAIRTAQRFNLRAGGAVEDPRGFRFIYTDPKTGGPVRFDPCTDLHYVVNLDGAPKGVLGDVRGAIKRTAEATGIHFVFDGKTDEVPLFKRAIVQPERYGNRWVPIVIAWSPADPSIFGEDGAGRGGGSYVANEDGRLVYVTGSILLNASVELSNGFGAGRTWGKVVLHELGHVVGLNHVDDPAQVMNPNLVSSPADWGVGDLAGLRALGKLAGCVDLPALP